MRKLLKFGSSPKTRYWINWQSERRGKCSTIFLRESDNCKLRRNTCSLCDRKPSFDRNANSCVFEFSFSRYVGKSSGRRGKRRFHGLEEKWDFAASAERRLRLCLRSCFCWREWWVSRHMKHPLNLVSRFCINYSQQYPLKIHQHWIRASAKWRRESRGC